MKTTRYRFEQAVQEVKEDSTKWLTEELRAILQSDKDFTRKADYIGFSIASIDAKVLSIDEEIKELQQLKKQLKSAKEIAVVTGAKVFAEYGIEKLDGAGISSITLTKESTKSKISVEILNETELIENGYSKTVLDIDAVEDALAVGRDIESIRDYVKVSITNTTTPSKLKVNKRRDSTNANLIDSYQEVA